jgi:hypothetical protein
VIWHTYQYNGKSQSLNAEVQEEQTKIAALLALGKMDEIALFSKTGVARQKELTRSV